MRAPLGRAPLDVSPDGEWLAYTYQLEETLPKATTLHSTTGVPLGDGDGRPQACLVNLRTGETILLGSRAGASWSPIWSPDGERIAFYSDEGGEAGLWIWERAARTARRFPGIIVRPLIANQAPRWSPDGRYVVAQILPEGTTVAMANAQAKLQEKIRRFPSASANEPSVLVLRASARTPGHGGAPDPSPQIVASDLEEFAADLALLEVRSGRVARLTAHSQMTTWWTFSPDGRYVAYTTLLGGEQGTQQSVIDLSVHDLATDRSRVVAHGLRSGGAIHPAWSPDSRSLAYLTTGPLAQGECFIVSVEGGAARKLGGETAPGFDPMDAVGFNSPDESSPYWDASGTSVFLPQGEHLWRLELDSGRSTRVASVPGRTLRYVVAERGASTFWSPDRGRSLIVNAIHAVSGRAGFHQIDLQTGASGPLLEEDMAFGSTASRDVSARTGELAFVAQDMRRAPDVWAFNVRTHKAKQLTHLNPQLDHHALGRAKVLQWLSMRGEALGGTLLLPGDYDSKRRYPLVVWVYCGDRGSQYANRFGIMGSSSAFNFQLLATRGYAVLFPDAPVRTGTPAADLADAVLSGVNAVITSGVADPDRVAVMGQSYGSFSTLSMITQSSRFKAAVISAVVDPGFVSEYLQLAADGTAGGIGYYEQGQGNMGGTLWEHRDRYLDNAPLLRFDRIETPLLIGHGTRDFLPLRFPDSVFVALRRLGKEVEYRIYEDEGHVIQRPANVIDFWNSRLEFLAEHLDLTLDEKGAIVFTGSRVRSRRDVSPSS